MFAEVEMSPIDRLPEDLQPLLEASAAEGYDFVSRLRDDWEEGSNRFQATGELLLEARIDGQLVAVGGLNRDPYLDDPTVGRLRHLYVAPSARGKDIGKALIWALVEHARGVFERVRVRAGSEDAIDFYEALGFRPTPAESDSTHDLLL